MTSILTNNGAMTALQTLRSINKNLTQTQNEISTGKSIATARDNSAIWAISKVMDSDVQGFKQISNSLALGQSTIAVARTAAESVTDLLTQIKGLIVSAQESNVDRAKIQTDITQLRNQIGAVVGAAQFNGLNLVDNGATASILSSLDRRPDGTVAASSITVTGQNLSAVTGDDLAAGGAVATAGVGTGTGVLAGRDILEASGGADIVIDTLAFQAGTLGQVGALARNDSEADLTNDAEFIAGDRLAITIGGIQGVYTVREGDVADTVLGGLKNSLQANGLSLSDYTIDVTATGAMTIVNNTNADVAFSFTSTRGTGALADLAAMDVSSAGGATTALGQIENMLQAAVSAAAEFGSAQKRIDIQAEFVSNLTSALQAGIGTLVDADMEEASARLQALQVQQQLGIQALSIANQAPQSILALFR
jgi:flagellin